MFHLLHSGEIRPTYSRSWTCSKLFHLLENVLLVNIFLNSWAHVLNDVVLHVLFLRRWVFENQLMDLLEILALVSILLWVSPCWALVLASSRMRGFQEELDELWPWCWHRGKALHRLNFADACSFKTSSCSSVFVVLCDEVDRTGFPPSSLTWATFCAIIFCHRVWSIDSFWTWTMYRLWCCRYLFRRNFSWLLGHAVAKRRSTIEWLHECVWWDIEPKRCVVLAKKNPWLTHQQSVARRSRISPEWLYKDWCDQAANRDRLCGFWKRVSCWGSGLQM